MSTQESPAGETASQYVPRHSPGYDDSYAGTGPGGAAKGFTLFAAVMLMISGIWNFLEGLSALIKGTFYLVLPNYAFNLSVASWGWWHLLMGIVVFASGAGRGTIRRKRRMRNRGMRRPCGVRRRGVAGRSPAVDRDRVVADVCDEELVLRRRRQRAQ